MKTLLVDQQLVDQQLVDQQLVDQQLVDQQLVDQLLTRLDWNQRLAGLPEPAARPF